MIKQTLLATRWIMKAGLPCMILCTACRSTQDVKTASSVAVEQPEEIKKNDVSPGYIESIMKDVASYKEDPTIEISKTEDYYVVSSPLESFNGDKPTSFMITFKDFVGKMPYRVDWRRLLQKDPSIFVPCIPHQTFLNAESHQYADTPPSLGISPEGFLPGERVTWRLTGADGTSIKEVTVCPRPMILKDRSNKIILEAALLAIQGSSLYSICIPALNEPVEFISTSGTETVTNSLPMGEPIQMSYLPGVIGMSGGVSQIEMKFLKDGSSYKMQLPWGIALLDYAKGKK